MGLVALWHVESSLTKDRTHVPSLAGGLLMAGTPGNPPAVFIFHFLLASLSAQTRRHFHSLVMCVGWNVFLLCPHKGVFIGYVLKKRAIVRHPIRIHWENENIKCCLLISINNRGITVGLVGEPGWRNHLYHWISLRSEKLATWGKMGLLWWFSLFTDQHNLLKYMDFPGGSDGKESACNAGDLGSIPGSGWSPGGGNGNPLQSSGLENSLDRRAWRAPVHGVKRIRHDWVTITFIHSWIIQHPSVIYF